jgi:hypothetical protein
MKRIRKDALERIFVGGYLRIGESIHTHQCCSVWRKLLVFVFMRLPHLSQRLMALGTALKQPEAAQLVAMTGFLLLFVSVRFFWERIPKGE